MSRYFPPTVRVSSFPWQPNLLVGEGIEVQPENRLPVVVIKQDHGIALGISEEYPIQVNNVTDDGLDQFVPLNLLFSSDDFKGYWLGCVLWERPRRGAPVLGRW